MRMEARRERRVAAAETEQPIGTGIFIAFGRRLKLLFAVMSQ